MWERIKVPIFCVLIVLCLTPATQAAMWQWSKTYGNNATADPFINWAEGMAPSAVNDSARAMMGKIAEWRDDISGALQTTGTSTAYAVTTNQSAGGNPLAATPTNGQMLAITPNTTNGANVTLAADGGTAFPIQTSPGNAVPSATMVGGTPYVVVFNTSSSAWILRSFYSNPFSIPIGGILAYGAVTTPNSNFALLNGQAISRTTYSTLFGLLSTAYGIGDGSTTFNLPDLRGRSPFGDDAMGTSHANRLTNAGSGCNGVLSSSCGNETQTLTQAQLPAVSIGVNISDPGHQHGVSFDTNNNGTQGGGVQYTVALRNSGGNTGVSTSTATTGISASTAALGSGSAHPNLPPALIIAYIMRIL